MSRPASFARALRAVVAVAMLAALAGMLAGVTAIAFTAAGRSEGEQRRFWLYSAWTASTMLAVLAVASVYLLARAMRRRWLGRRPAGRSTPQVDPWVLAGKRIEPDETNMPTDPDADDEDDPRQGSDPSDGPHWRQ